MEMGCHIVRRPLTFLDFIPVLSVFLLNDLFVDGFNIDAFNYAVYGTQHGSMFGFTVALHKQGQNRGWVLVGAPEAQSQYQGDQVRLGGVVYKCRPDIDDPCQEIPFDRDGNQFFGNREMDQKSGQWFGATLSTSGNPLGGPVVGGIAIVKKSPSQIFADSMVLRNQKAERRQNITDMFAKHFNSVYECFQDVAAGNVEHKGDDFGVNVDVIEACAPRYVWYSKEMNRRDPVGTCFVSDSSFEKFEEYSPCRTSNWGYHRQGSCQAGFSAAVNSIGDRLFVGAPGSYYWQGQMYSIDAHARFNYTPGLLGTTYGAKGSVHQQSLETRPAVFQTREGKQQDDDSYMGYSTLVGDFLSTGEQGIAVGMPRGAELHGKILLFTWNLTNYKNISSNQLGSYFGYSLAAADVDGDKKLDLIVGAPMHTESNTQGKYDVGRVYVFYFGGGYGSFNKSSFLDGINSKSRFGHSVAYLGDLNLDGYEDFAVGAPYDGQHNRGAVYIYYGSSKGVLEKYGQVIYAEDVVSRNGIAVNTFGFSVTGGLDMDGNDYPDMAVGAYLSNSAFFFRSRPVVRVESFVRFRTENKQIDIKKKNCDLPNGQRGTCTIIDFCIKYSGRGIPQQIRLNVQYILDTKKPNIPRLAFLRKNTHTLNETIALYKDGRETCQTEKIYIKNDIRDKVTQLEAEVKYFMIQEDRDASYYGRVRNPQSQLKPVLDLNLPPSRKDSIIIQKNCGDDNICVPNLHVNVTKNVEKYLLNSSTNLEFDIIVSNLKEDSFETTFDVTYPEGIHYRKTEVNKDMPGILCSAADADNRTISCDIGNPLQANKIAKFRMIFAPDLNPKEGMPSTYEFDMHVNSSNPEDNSTLQDNYSHITVDIWVNSALDVSGRSIPQEIYIPNATQYTSERIDRESDIGPQVTHLYTLRNKGPTIIYEAEMYILWPWQTLAGEDLLYLLDQPHVPEGVKCEITPANYKNYQLDYNPKPIWERLQIDSSNNDMDHKHSSMMIESGRNITAVAGGSRVTGRTSILDEEIKSSSGDASTIYEKRHNSSTSSAFGSTPIGWGAGSGHDSTGHISKAGETVYTETVWRTTLVNGHPVIKWTNVTTMKDATGKTIKTEYSTDDSNSDQVSGGYKQKPKIIYTSSGNADAATREENLSISGRFSGGHEQSPIQEDQYQHKTISGVSQQNVYTGQQSSSRSGGGVIDEQKHTEEYAYTVGGGAREGGGQLARQRFQGSYGDQSIQQSAGSSTANKAYEEKRQYEERPRQQLDEQQRKSEQQQGQNTVVTFDENKRNQANRRPQTVTEDERKRQQPTDNERRRQYMEEDGRYQWSQQQRGNGLHWSQQQSGGGYSLQQNGNRDRSSYGERTLTGSFDAQGNYHDESGASEGRGGPGVVFNRTWTVVEGTENLDDVSQAGALDLGQTAASGSGFRTQTIDLGMTGGGTSGASSSRGQQQDISVGQNWVSSGQRRQGGSFSGTLEGGVSAEDQYRTDWQRNRWEDEQVPSQAHNYIERDNVPTDKPDLSRRRGKRQVPEIDPYIDDLLKCTATNCFYVKCVVGTLKKDDFISIALRSRLNIRAVKHLTTTQPLKLSSMMVARITKLPYIGKPKEQALHSHEIFTDVPAGEPEQTPRVVPLWIILLSAIAGTLILLLVILLLYKCGFFKRKRPSSAPERQPLRTNGYHPGE